MAHALATMAPGQPQGPEPQQIALEVFRTVPARCIVHAATDNRNAPLIRKGEIVVVDHDGMTGWYPTEGGLFLIEYVSRPVARYERVRRSREIVQTFTNRRGDWRVGAMRHHSAVDGVFYLCDGPYEFEQLAEKLLGPVLGILSLSGEAAK